jgi:hypothetical protein
VPVQAKSLRPQAPNFFIERVHFLSASRVPGFWRIGGAQLFQRLLDGEFGCFGHGKPHIQGDQAAIDLDQHDWFADDEIGAACDWASIPVSRRFWRLFRAQLMAR